MNKSHNAVPHRSGLRALLTLRHTLLLLVGLLLVLGATAPAHANKSRIFGNLFCDHNNNGIRNSDDPGLENVLVSLYDSNNQLFATRTTNADGRYDFRDLPAGTYTVQVEDPAQGLILTGTNNVVIVLPKSTTIRQNFAYRGGEISGVAYIDTNTNLVRNTGEPRLAGLLIILEDSNGNVIDTDITDATGFYRFRDCLEAGTYKVYAPPTAGSNILETPSPLTVILTTGQISKNNNFGYIPDTRPFRTQTQGGWGNNPAGNNPGKILDDNFAILFPSGITIGGGFTAHFSTRQAVTDFLPAGGPSGSFTQNYNDPTSTSAGNLAGQVLALQISVEFSLAGVFRAGLADLKVQSGDLQGYTVAEVLALGNAVLGGDTSGLPSGVSISDLNDVVTAINENYVDGTTDEGYLGP